MTTSSSYDIGDRVWLHISGSEQKVIGHVQDLYTDGAGTQMLRIEVRGRGKRYIRTAGQVTAAER